MLYKQPNLIILLLSVLVFYNVVVHLAAKSSSTEILNLAFTIGGKVVVILMAVLIWYALAYVYRMFILT